MFDQQIALELSQRDSLGIGDLLLRQIDTLQSSEQLPASEAAQEILYSEAAGLSTRQRSDFRPADPQAFVSEIWEYAVQTGRELGVEPRVIVAQAALETGWGDQLIRDAKGVSGNNLFGIKADDRWNGEQIGVSTLEFEGARFVPRFSQFRAYPNLAEGFAGYQQFLSDNPRYAEAIRHSADSEQFLRGLQEAGYATDPDYAEKIERIIESSQLSEFINQADGR